MKPKFAKCEECKFHIAVQLLLDIGYYASADDANFMHCEDCEGENFKEEDE